MRVTLEYFVGPGGIDQIPEEFRTALFGNIREWQALTSSTDAFPNITRAQVHMLAPPVLMLSGGRTYPMHPLVDAELERQLRNVRRKVVPDGTHDVCSEQPPVCAAAIRSFLDEVSRPTPRASPRR
jgi:pimeloyl-ACP methyl ester carboxylesterase